MRSDGRGKVRSPASRRLFQPAEAEPHTPLFTCDVRGIGDSRPDTNFSGWATFLGPRGTDYFYAIHALMLDRPYVGRRTQGLLRVLDWLGGFDHTEVHLVAKGWGALPAAFAAILHERVTQVTLKYALTSYTDIATSESYGWPLSSFLPGALEKFGFSVSRCRRHHAGVPASAGTGKTA